MKKVWMLLLTIALLEGSECHLLSVNPRIYYLADFLSKEECDYIIKLAGPYLQRSRVFSRESDAYGVESQGRTSRGMFLYQKMLTPKVAEIEKRISKVMGIPRENGEPMQVVHYKEGEEYQYHYDTFDTAMPGSESIYLQGGQRTATFLIYLNNVEEGGETHFYCPDIKVHPKRGDVVIFFPSFKDGTPDSATLHAGLPVIRGEKWIMTRWFRQGAYKN